MSPPTKFERRRLQGYKEDSTTTVLLSRLGLSATLIKDWNRETACA